MRRPSPIALLLACAACGSATPPQPTTPAPVAPPAPAAVAPPAAADPLVSAYLDTAKKIAEAARSDDGGWKKLEFLTDHIGNRLSGSAALVRATAWAEEAMKADGHENVRQEKVMVPQWVRGAEGGDFIAPVRRPLVLIGLGGSAGTPPAGITADVVVVKDWEDMKRRGNELAGKIVFFDVSMAQPTSDAERISPGRAYGDAASYRGRGPARAAKLGAVAVLVRSVTTRSLRTPHTGATSFREGEKRIPCAAITLEDAALISRLDAAGETVRVRMRMGARLLPDAPSANVIGEIVGRELPKEVVVIGGHIDSWDVGQGAHDDGTGCVHVMQALTVLRRLGLTPRRTIRVVLFTNEENGLAGGKAYAATHEGELDGHVAAIETDGGGFRPVGYGVETGEAAKPGAVALARRLSPLFDSIGAGDIGEGHGGADISAMGIKGVPLLGFRVDGTHYFDIHHTQADTLDKVNPDELKAGIASIAIMAYVLADMPDKLPRAPIPLPQQSE